MGKTVQAWHVENQGERSKGSELFIYLFKTKHSLFGALSNIHSLVLCSHHELKKKKNVQSSPVQLKHCPQSQAHCTTGNKEQNVLVSHDLPGPLFTTRTNF